MPALINEIESTELFVGTAEAPRQVVRVWLAQDGFQPYGGEVEVRVTGPGVLTPEPVRLRLDPGELERTVEVGVLVDPPVPAGTRVPVTVVVSGAGWRIERGGPITVAEPGWTVFLVPHFHFDPVWWNTQANYTEHWEGWAHPRLTFQDSAFGLLDKHLARALADPDYTFVVAELDYLKPYWDSRPEQRGAIRALLAQGRLELMGGTYNEPSSNLSSPEATARNAVYGSGFQRAVLGGDPQSAWQLDVFGHDPQFPGLMAAAGLSSTAWARGPFQTNGPTYDYLGAYPLFFSRSGPFRDPLTVRDPSRMEFPSEFEWISPSGAGLLTSYLHNHYLGGWSVEAASSLAEAEQSLYQLFLLMKRVTATHNLLLPIGTDFAAPPRWITDIHRDWHRRYVWPRFTMGVPRDFFAAVRAELKSRGRVAIPQTRDMNPIWAGKDVSLIDTKQAQRAIEHLLVDAEKFATLNALAGEAYPEERLDLAWRQVFFGAHHDAVTGTGSDQVYVDLLGSWREAYDTAGAVYDDALDALARRVDTAGDGVPVLVTNALAEQRTDLVRVRVAWPGGGARLVDPYGVEVPFVVDGVAGGGTPVGRESVGGGEPIDGESGVGEPGEGEITLAFVARDLPSLGYATYRLYPAEGQLPQWQHTVGTSAANETYQLEIDPARGGCLSRLVHVPTGADLLPDGRVGNELLVYDEYSDHPNMGEGPWLVMPTGAVLGSAGAPATVAYLETSPAGTRATVQGEVGGVRYTQILTLWHGLDRVDCRLRVDEFRGRDKLLRLRLPTAVAGGRPVAEVGDAVIGRGFGFPDVDSATAPWTLDTPCNQWCAVGWTARVATAGAAQALGVAEIVAARPDDPASPLRELAVALARAGVTATATAPAGPRYGNLDVDSNLPDFRVGLGHPADNAFVDRVLTAEYRAELARQLAAGGRAVVWVPAARDRAERTVPMADLRAETDLPVLVVAGPAGDAAGLSGAVAAVVADLARDATVRLVQPAATARLEGLDDLTVALLNRGTPGFVVDPSGALHISLLRSCTGWPSGVWIDPPVRRLPDGSAFALQHWTHDFEYAIAAGAGDWRAAGMVGRGHAFNHPPRARVTAAHPGELPTWQSLVRVEPAGRAILTALKPAGNPIPVGAASSPVAERGVTVRLYEAAGRAVTATVEVPTGWSDAHLADLLERPESAVTVRDGAALVPLGGAQIATLTGRVRDAAVGTIAGAGGSAPEYARYWLHNRGAAPAGYVPLSVHVAQRSVSSSGAPRTVEVTIASDRRDEAKGELSLVAPEGWAITPSRYDYQLPPGGYVNVPVLVSPADGAAAGEYPVLARILDDAGHQIEDVCHFTIPGADQPATLEVGVDLDAPAEGAVRVAAGGRGALRLWLRNRTPGALTGTLHLVAPFAAWHALPVAAVPLVLQPGERREVSVPLLGAIPAGEYWLLPKAVWHGRRVYAAPVRLVVG